MTFHVGQQVVCIDGAAGFEQTVEVEEGAIYTVSWIGPFDHYIHGNYIGVRLVGIDRGECPQFGYKNPPFAARRFRPLVRDKLSSLRGLLAGGPVTEKFEEPKRKVREEV
ncbi:hypothetical protein DKP76_06970 [Falsochrobactrum shanghaiense]|uniref:CAP-Gly domain protein n=1 Tax=Falsochrobactrum shanghaiense TaxID=2201899 RepID=A0A316JUF6_9HYPH|nr:hypothetical protein [Falsochrobactrum shanghaiense]PWL18800.1 hypothetical protein DKP76_06970 [Falsochrobactrum shanghaiense]